jgi:hypothetical protein
MDLRFHPVPRGKRANSPIAHFRSHFPHFAFRLGSKSSLNLVVGAMNNDLS